MAEVQVTVSYHFKIDPAKLTLGAFFLPASLKRTIAIGDDIASIDSVQSSELSSAAQEKIDVGVEAVILKVNRRARAIDASSEAVAGFVPEPPKTAIVEESNKSNFELF